MAKSVASASSLVPLPLSGRSKWRFFVDCKFWCLLGLVLAIGCSSERVEQPNPFQKFSGAAGDSIPGLSEVRVTRLDSLDAFADTVEGEERKCFYREVSVEKDNGVLVRLRTGGDTQRWYVFEGNRSSQTARERVTASVEKSEACPAIDVMLVSAAETLPDLSGVSIWYAEAIASNGIEGAVIESRTCLYPDVVLPQNFKLRLETTLHAFVSEFGGGSRLPYAVREVSAFATHVDKPPSLTGVRFGAEDDWNCRSIGLFLLWWNE